MVADSLQRVARQARGCTRCRLSGSRTHAVPGEGPPEASLVLVGEGPGAAEDATGRPFQGAAGRFLDEMLARLGVQRSRLFITSMVKCRPPGNRMPRADELAACRGYLDRQLQLVAARAVLAMGGTAAAQLHPTARRAAVKVGDLRGSIAILSRGTPLLVTYHPAAAMRFPACREPFRRDLAAACRLAGLLPAGG